MPERVVTVDLGDGMTIAVAAEQHGPQMVADGDLLAKLSAVMEPIERVSRDAVEALRRAAPTRGTVELGFGIAIEQGQLIALFGKGKGEASITVTLEWDSTAQSSAPQSSTPQDSTPQTPTP